MADRAQWARRVAAWRASGLSSPAFCEGQPFTAGGLRLWAHLLAKEARERRAQAPVLRLGRVVRVGPPAPRARPAAARGDRREPSGAVSAAEPPALAPEAALVVELGAARLTVWPGVDRAILATVLELLAAPTGPR